MNEAQLKAIIRQGFSLQNTADKAVLQVDQVLANAMSQVKRLVEVLPEEGLLRGRAWKDLEPLVKQELNVYGQQLGSAIENALVDAEPGMEAAAIREAKLGGADFGPETISINPAGGRVQGTVERALNSQVNNVTVKSLFNIGGETKTAPIDQALFRTVDTRVRKGMIQGWTTQEIADLMATDVISRGVPGVNLNAEAAKIIRNQSMAIARTATQDMARQVKQEVYDANADAMEGMEYEWTTALDSRTCETCSPLDGRRWKDQKQVPSWPLHPNCRCQAVPVDPEDPFWNEPEKTAQVISETPFKYKGKPVPSLTGAEREAARRAGYYQSKVKVNGKQYYRKVETVTSDTPPPRYSDILAKWAAEPYAAGHETSLVQSMGGGPIGEKRARWFKKEYDRLNKDPQQILQAMLTGEPGAQKFIPIEELLATKVKLPVKRAVKKAAPKPKVVVKPAPPKQAQSTPAAGPQGVDLTAARAKLRAKKAAQAQAEQAALKAATNKASGKAQAAKLQAEKNAAFKAKDLKKEAEIKSLKEGDEVTFAVGGVYGKGKVVTKPDLFDPKLPMQIKADADGPGWKKGDLIPANKNSKFISKGDPPKVAGLDASKLSDAEKASKAKFDAFMAEKAKASAQAAIKKAKVTLRPPAPVTVAPKPAVDIAKSFDDSKNSLGSGFFGEARLVDSGVTKRGWLSKNELDALEALKDTGITPKPLGVSFVGEEWNKTLYKGTTVRKGYLAMDKAPGETIGKILDFGGGFTERQSREVTNSLLRARKKIHLKGVAHQDMHGNNVLYDLKSKQMTIIDLGTARIDARSALVEALGTNRGRMSFGQVEVPGDYQSRPTFTLLNRTSKLADNPVWKRFNANRKAVEAKLKAEGAGSILDASIRKLPRDVTKNLSPARALELLEELYEGI